MTAPTKILTMTVGLPRSGKSTWARQQFCPIVNPDSIRLAIHGQPFVASAEPLVWAVAKAMVRALFEAGHDVVILDATNTTKKRRDEWRDAGWKRQFAIFGADKETCIERARKSGRDDLVPVIERMEAQFEALHGEDDGVRSFYVRSDGYDSRLDWLRA